MPTYHLLVSDPPHAENWDALAAASQLGLVAAEMRMRASFAAPEIWAADESEDVISAKRDALRAAGLRVAKLTSDDIAAVPEPALVKAFTFTEDATIWSHAQGDDAMANASVGILVSCRWKEDVQFFKEGPGAIARGARAGYTRAMYMRTGGAIGLAIGTMAAGIEAERERVRSMGSSTAGQRESFLDLYLVQEGGSGAASRFRLGQDQGLNFGGLGDLMGSTAHENFKTLLDVMQARCPDVGVDECLLDVQPRQVPVIGIGLPHVLRAIDESGHMGPLELASRLVFLTWLKGSE